MSSFRIITQLIVDVAVTVAFFVLGCCVAGYLHNTLTPNIRGCYVVWFAAAMLPFCYYACWRGVACFDKWDILVYSPVPFIIGFMPLVIRGNHALFGLLLSVVVFGLYRLRRMAFPSKSNGSLTKGR